MTEHLKSKAIGTSDRVRPYWAKFYSAGGWGWTLGQATVELRNVVMPLANWLPGGEICDLGCGDGVHTQALCDLGFSAYGLETSPEAVAKARRQFSGVEYYDVGAELFEPPRPLDGIYCRGMSWFHYELDGVNRYGIDVPFETRRLFGWLNSGGTFVLQICTDFRGTFSETNVLNNTLEAYLDLFAPLGEIRGYCDWRGEPIREDREAASGIVIGVRQVVR